MFKKTIIALAAAAALTGASLAASAPAAAHDYDHDHDHYYYNHYYHPHYWVGSSYYVHTSSCYWTWKSEKIWTYHGPEWVSHKVQVCD
jgi:hypothetical protein